MAATPPIPFRPVPRTRCRSAVRIAVLWALIPALPLLWLGCAMLKMPGRSFRGPLPPLTERQAELSAQLRRDVTILATDASPRTVFTPTRMNVAVEFLESALRKAGHAVARQTFDTDGVATHNLIVELPGSTRANEIVIVGAHYDHDGPGADDNASGVAGLLALARMFPPDAKPTRTLRFVLFANEEPPFFKTDLMGSVVYARACRERNENVVAMICLEMIGYYVDTPTQRYPFPAPLASIYPKIGDFVAFVGNWASRGLVHETVRSFRQHARFPSEGGAIPELVPELGFSDHWPFWREGYPALMVTDTSFYRYPYYHTNEDTPDKLDYDRMARVVEGLGHVVADLAAVDAP